MARDSGQTFAARMARLVLGPPPPAALPPRVLQAIAEDRRDSETLVCLVQFAAIAFFAAFYVLTPKAFGGHVPFEPVPLALAAYAAFTALRLLLARTNRLGPVFLGLSVVVDVAVLMVTIWSFHLQYQQPAAIYLKAPTLLYVFILIALRTLRFDLPYVLLAGAAAILGWGVLVAYAIADAGRMEITRSFVTYMMSFQILIGAEVDKVVSMAAVTAVLGLAVVRARRLALRVAAESHAAAELSRFLDPGVAEEIRHAAAALRPGDAVMRQAAVMMLDLRGFTAMAAELGPQGTLALLAEFHATAVPVVLRHGGAIDKYLGDGIMATFGAVAPRPTHAADALRALDDLRRAFADWNAARAAQGLPPVQAGAAVTVGEVLSGVTGSGTRLEFTVIGPAVNLAAKIEKHCKAEQRGALVTAEALARAAAQGLDAAGRYVPLPGRQVEGVAGPVDLAAPA
jgi:adenylate cyclase